MVYKIISYDHIYNKPYNKSRFMYNINEYKMRLFFTYNIYIIHCSRVELKKLHIINLTEHGYSLCYGYLHIIK